jgi:pimeloyl-ACP methyl ester carboxylesterase
MSPVFARVVRRPLHTPLVALALACGSACGDTDVENDVEDDVVDVPDAPIEVDPARFVPPADAFDCGGGVSCFFVDVPVDPAEPDGDTIQIRAGFLPARSANPIGILAVNFGGFGAPGVPNLQGWASAVPELHENFHALTWDPRGSGGSTPLTCASDFAAVMAAAGPLTTLAEAEAQVDVRRTFLDGCRAQHGPMIDHMGYRTHAADLDAVRAGLDVPRLNYLGYSAGTALGQAYAEFYPEHLNRVAWDSSIVAHGGARTFMKYQAPEAAVAANDFATFCASAPECTFGDPIEAIEIVLADADAGALTRGDGMPLTWLEAAYGIVLPLYQPSGYSLLVDALTDAKDGDGAFLETLSNAYNSSDTSGAVAPSALVYFLTNCAEELAPTSAQDALDANQAYSLFSALGPVYATDHAWCAALGAPLEPLGVAMTAPDVEQTILVMQSAKDLATPLAAGEEVVANIENARLVIHDGAGHTPSTFNRCMANILNDYLVRGVVPAEGTHCPAEG